MLRRAGRSALLTFWQVKGKGEEIACNLDPEEKRRKSGKKLGELRNSLQPLLLVCNLKMANKERQPHGVYKN